MSKEKRSNKETRKKPLMTAKERKIAKRNKKSSVGNILPFEIKG